MLKYLVASHNASLPSKPPDNNVPFSSRRTQKMLFCLWKNKVRECATVTPLSWLATYKYISKIYNQMTTTFPNGVTWVKIFNTDTKGTETTINKLCYRGVYTLEVQIFWSWYQVFHQKNASNEWGAYYQKDFCMERCDCQRSLHDVVFIACWLTDKLTGFINLSEAYKNTKCISYLMSISCNKLYLFRN